MRLSFFMMRFLVSVRFPDDLLQSNRSVKFFLCENTSEGIEYRSPALHETMPILRKKIIVDDLLHSHTRPCLHHQSSPKSAGRAANSLNVLRRSVPPLTLSPRDVCLHGSGPIELLGLGTGRTY